MRIDLAKQRPVGSDVRRQVRSSGQSRAAAERAAGGSRERVESRLPAFRLQSRSRLALSRLPMGRSVQRRLTQKATEAGKSALRVRRPGMWSRLVAGFCRGYAILYLEGRGPKLSDAAGAETATTRRCLSRPAARGPSVLGRSQRSLTTARPCCASD